MPTVLTSNAVTAHHPFATGVLAGVGVGGRRLSDRYSSIGNLEGRKDRQMTSSRHISAEESCTVSEEILM
jgi:hypothetical protein